jgi:hypothetical protein
MRNRWLPRFPLDDGDARPRIEACFERSDIHKAADDIACLGRMLTVIQRRLLHSTGCHLSQTGELSYIPLPADETGHTGDLGWFVEQVKMEQNHLEAADLDALQGAQGGSAGARPKS